MFRDPPNLRLQRETRVNILFAMSDVLSHYGQTPEDDRLRSGWGALELARTQELILRRLPAPPQTILDVGGGAGIYSEWLGSLGYETHLVDPVPRHVETARQIRGIASAAVGDARHLAQAGESVDAVLFLGPLYHLTERSERLLALREAHRVLRRNGLLFAATISRFGSLFDGLARGFIDDPLFMPILERDLVDGHHRNPTGKPEYFTTAFFHRPEEIQSEIREAGFSLIELAGIEGPGWLASNFVERWSDPSRRQRLLELVRKVEAEPLLIAVSPHCLSVARK
jgi:SAM-dependent methyltransferase